MRRRHADATSNQTEEDTSWLSFAGIRFATSGSRRSDTWMPPVDIYQNGEHELVLKAELPDMAREDIDITVENFDAHHQGREEVRGEVKEEQFHHIERRYGTFSRSFSLPPTVDPGKVAAEYKNGVLTVRLPLREEAKPRQIKVDVAA